MALRDFTKLHVVYAERSLFDPDIVYLYTSNGGLILVKNARDRQGNPIPRWFVSRHAHVFYLRRDGRFSHRKPSYRPLRHGRGGCVNYLDFPELNYPLHLMVINTWKGVKPFPHYQCDHIDGNPRNNDIDNLEWVTPEEHIRRRYQMFHARFKVVDPHALAEREPHKYADEN